MADLLTRYVHLNDSIITVGGLVGSDALHPFAPDTHTGTSCLACFGWSDDARHAFHTPLPIGGGRG